MSRRWIIAVPVVALLIAVMWHVHAQSESHAPGYSISADSLIREISALYGEGHPRVLRLDRTFTDPFPQEPMYFVHLSGRFHRFRVQADELYFSALADRRVIWGVAGYQGRGAHRQMAWMDCKRNCTGAVR
jgi:hypothetical protein